MLFLSVCHNFARDARARAFLSVYIIYPLLCVMFRLKCIITQHSGKLKLTLLASQKQQLRSPEKWDEIQNIWLHCGSHAVPSVYICASVYANIYTAVADVRGILRCRYVELNVQLYNGRKSTLRLRCDNYLSHLAYYNTCVGQVLLEMLSLCAAHSHRLILSWCGDFSMFI
jgi:hypothetical protein